MIAVSGEVAVARPPAELWRLLLDPKVLCRTVPECEELEPIGPNLYRIAFKVRLGFLRSRFRGELALRDVVEFERCRIEVNASGTGGSLLSETRLHLVPHAGGASTLLRYQGEARASGLIASVGLKWAEGNVRTFVEQYLAEIAKL